MRTNFSGNTCALLIAILLLAGACGEGEIATPVAKTDSPQVVATESKKTSFSKEAIDTVDNMMLVTNGFLAYQAEHWQKLPEATNFQEVTTILSPVYISNLSQVDGWGIPFSVEVTPSRGVLRFGSGGADKTLQSLNPEASPTDAGQRDDPTLDFIASSSGIFQYPSLGAIATTQSPSIPLKVVRSTAVRFGERGRYVAIQGVVGNGSASAFASIQPLASITCAENPQSPLVTKKPEKILEPETRVPYLQPGMLQPFRKIVQLDLATLPQPCTLAASPAFHETGNGRPISHEVLGNTRSLMEGPAEMTSADATSGEVITHVNTVKRQILSEISERAGVSYEIKASDRLALDITPLPYEATTKALREHFTGFMSKKDWTQESVDSATVSASRQIADYLQTLSPGPESAEWTQFRHRNFAVLKLLAQKKLTQLNANG